MFCEKCDHNAIHKIAEIIVVEIPYASVLIRERSNLLALICIPSIA